MGELFVIGTIGLQMLVLQSRDVYCCDVWNDGELRFKLFTSLYCVRFCARQEDYGTSVVVSLI